MQYFCLTGYLKNCKRNCKIIIDSDEEPKKHQCLYNGNYAKFTEEL